MTEQDPVAKQEKEQGPRSSTGQGTRLLPRGEWRLAVLMVLVFSVCLAIVAYIEDKTVWDWLDLVLVPFILVVVAHQLHAEHDRVQRKTQEDQLEREQKLADEHWELEQDLARQAREDSAFQEYLSQMANLLMIHGLLVSQANGEGKDRWKDQTKKMLARVRTLSALWQVDSKRKRNVLVFLYEAGLITGGPDQKGIVELHGANLLDGDLCDIQLPRVALDGADLKGAHLTNANLSEANLGGADLRGAHLIEADLRGAHLVKAKLGGAKLVKANMSGANLEGASGWTEEQLRATEALEGATMPNGQKYEYWLRDGEGRAPLVSAD